MCKDRHVLIIFAMAAIVLACSTHVFAAPTESLTWVSGTGNDTNPCSQTAPCKTFAGAISKTAAGGEIDTLDPGNFGPVTIAKSITIEGANAQASIQVLGNYGITVAAGPKDKVIIRAIEFQGHGSGLSAINFKSGGSLYVDNCKIAGFTDDGILFAPSGTASTELFVSGTAVEANTNPVTGTPAGINMTPASSVTSTAVIDRCRIEGYQDGLFFSGNIAATVIQCDISGNSASAIDAIADSVVTVVDSNLSSNAGSGVLVNSPTNATVFIRHDTIVNNNVGLNNSIVTYTGTNGIISYGDNVITNNVTSDGLPNHVNSLR